jgi:hypothetical protein
MFTRESAKRSLKSKGWTYRTVAPYLGVTYQHLSEVLNGKRQSRRIITKIPQLPEAPALLRASRQLKEGK